MTENLSKVSALSPIEYPPHIEPPFWGSGELLFWEPESILQTIGDNLRAAAGKAENAALEEHFEGLCSEIITDALLDARGYYSFFPVITDDTTLVVIDPGDFVTELVTCIVKQCGELGGRSVVDYLRPEGDLIGIQAATLGWKLARRVEEYGADSTVSAKGILFAKVADLCTNVVAQRLSGEMRRGLGLERNAGSCVTWGTLGTPHLHDIDGLFAILGGEERLGLTVATSGVLLPRFLNSGLFIHHPDLVV